MAKSWLTVSVIVLTVLACAAGAQPPSFDHLAPEDRDVMRKRFEAEVWPLLTRNGKDGCVGCHTDRKNVTALRMSGDASKDFAMLLRDGFFLPSDDGSLLSRVLDRAPDRRMPPGKRAAWSEADANVLRAFVRDVEAKQKK